MLSKKDKQGIALLGGVTAVLLGLLAVSATLSGKPKLGADNCIGDVTTNTVVLLDYTEEVSQQTKEEIAARALAHIREHVKVNERVSVFTISDLSKNQLKPVVSLCRPPEDGNRAVESVQLIKKRFQQNFEKPIKDVLSRDPGNSKESPIAQALTDISLSQYLRGSSNTLLVFSDMLEHTSKFSLYTCDTPDSVVSRYKASVSGAKERPEFKNTYVSLNIVPRLDQSKTTLKCRDKFWPWFFGDNVGPNAKAVPDFLPGGASMAASTKSTKK